MKFICALLLTLLCIQTVNAQPIITRDPEDIWAIQWSPDATKLAVGYYNGHFQVFDTSDMSLIFQDNQSTIPVRWFGWSPSGTRLAVGYVEAAIDIWDIMSLEKELSITVGNLGAGSLTWSNDENYLFVGTGNIDVPTLRKYNLSNSEITHYINNKAFYDLILLENANQAIAFGYDRINFIDTNNLTVIDYFDTSDESQDRLRGRATAMSLYPSQQFIAVGYTGYQVDIWDLETRQIITTLDAGMPFDDTYGVVDLAFNETGTRLFAVTFEGTIRSWDTATWQLIEQTDIDAMILNADFSSDGRYLAYGDLEQDSQIFIRNLCDFVALDGASLENILPQANNFNEEAQICLTENGQYDLTAPLPTITGDITIIGNGARITMIGEGQIFTVGEFGNLTLKNITVGGE
jgi:WD40 repeat protein